LTEYRHRNSIAAIESGEVVESHIVARVEGDNITWRNHER